MNVIEGYTLLISVFLGFIHFLCLVKSYKYRTDLKSHYLHEHHVGKH